MAGGVISVISAVPWGTVVDSIPKVIEGATKLIGLTRRNAGALQADVDVTSMNVTPFSPALSARMEGIDNTILSLGHRIEEAGNLIRVLAQSNEIMARQISTQRIWLFGLSGALAIALCLSIFASIVQ